MTMQPNGTTKNEAGVDRGIGDDWLEKTELFRRWNAMKEEILRHKWYQSEKAGYDIGWDRAATNWMLHHRRGFQQTALLDASGALD